MRLRSWLAVAAVSSAAFVGLDARADLFERFRARSDANVSRSVDDPNRLSVEIADESEIGKILIPVAYQPGEPLPAPLPADGPLTPIPEASGPAIGHSYFPATPSPAYGGPVIDGPTVVGPVVGPGGFGPGYPVGPDAMLGGFPLFDRVEYEDLRNIHPCATPTVVQVLDPCTPRERCRLLSLFSHRRHVDACDTCLPCGPRVVYVKICVPPGCPDVRVSRKGRRVTYDYGDYKVQVTSKDGYVKVDYDD